MTTPDDNPYAPPAYPPPEGPAFAPSPGDAWTPDAEGVEPDDAVTRPVAGVPTESVAAPRPPRNRDAGRAFLLGLLSLPLTPVVGIAAVVIGRRALTEVAQTGERGTGLARAGFWMGGAFSLLWVLAVVFLIAMQMGSIAS